MMSMLMQNGSIALLALVDIFVLDMLGAKYFGKFEAFFNSVPSRKALR